MGVYVCVCVGSCCVEISAPADLWVLSVGTNPPAGPTWISRQRKDDIKVVGQFDGGEEAHMASVPLGQTHRRQGHLQGGGVGRYGQCQHHPSAGTNPEQVLANQECCDPQTGSLVLADNGIRTCQRDKEKDQGLKHR